MHTEVMKWASIVALLVALLFWPSTANYLLELSLVVTTGAALVFVQAYRANSYGLAVGFLCLAVLFNPVLPYYVQTKKPKGDDPFESADRMAGNAYRLSDLETVGEKKKKEADIRLNNIPVK